VEIRVPPKPIRERFQLIYELEGCQKAVNFLTEYYGIRRMKILLNGRKVGNGYIAQYFENKAIFTKRGLKKRTILHELYHHLIYSKNLEMTNRMEENEANDYARKLLNGYRN
jgi:hypothetical protein